MKRKIFSKLLMVALVIAAVSSFVSCKDYDDDINNLRDQVNKAALQSNLEALQQKVDANASTAASAAAAALKAAQDAAAAATTGDASLKAELEKAIKEAAAAVDAKATENGTKLADALKAISDLQAAVEKAQKTADAAATPEDVTKAVAASSEELTKAIAAAKEELVKAIADAQAAAEKTAAEKAAEADAALKTQLEKAIADVKTVADQAKALAEKAATKEQLTALNTELTGKISTLNTKLNDYYTKTEVDALIGKKIAGLQNADQVLATIQSELSKYGLSKADETVATQISNAVSALKTELAAQYVSNEKFSELSGAAEALGTSVEVLYSAVTSVELISSYNGRPGYVLGRDLIRSYGGVRYLAMLHGFVGDNSTFGDETDCGTVANPFDYVKDTDIKTASGLVVRVNPVNADLTKAKIVLVNSLGEGLDDYVEAGTPVRYTGLITRGTNLNTGLWVIPFTVKDGIDEDALLSKTRTFDADGNPDKFILHAVAVNNTGDADETRFVTSTYDVAPEYEQYEPAVDFFFNVNDQQNINIRNRWDYDNKRIVAEQKIKGIDYDKYLYPELKWQMIKNSDNVWVWDPQPSFNYERNADGSFKNKRLAFADNDERNRTLGYHLLPVKVDVPFTIANVYQYPVDPIEPEYDGYNQIEYYYVALDCHNAIESSPSEINAWESYNYDGLYTRVSADESLEITIHDGAKSVATGDVIGFRVYAVNYDGTLADPDGKAFYVYVGDDKSTTDLGAATITATDTLTLAGGKTSAKVLQSTAIDVKGIFDADYQYWIKLADNNKGVIVLNDATILDEDNNYWDNGVRPDDFFTFIFYKGSTVLKTVKGSSFATFNGKDVKDATKLQITANIDVLHDIYNLVDNDIYSFVIKGREVLDDQVDWIDRETMTFTVQKLLPTAVTLPEFRSAQSADGTSFISYMVPDSMKLAETPANQWDMINSWNTLDPDNKFFHSNVTGRKGTVADYYADYTAKGFDTHNKNGRISGFKDLNNVFYNLNEDTLYSFKFNTSMTDAKKRIGNNTSTKYPVYVSTWDENHPLVTVAGVNPPFVGAGYANAGNYKSYKTRYVLAVPATLIDGTTSHTIDVSHKYLGVSTKLDEDGEATLELFKQTHLATTAEAFTVIYAPWIKASTFTNVAKPSLQWKTTPEKADTLKFTNITSTNTYNGELFSKNLSALINAQYLNPVVTKIQFVSANGHVNEYFQPEPETLGTASTAAGTPDLPLFKLEATDGRGTAGDIVLCVTQVSTQLDANPIADHDENLEITVVDAFNQEHKISVPVEIKRAAN